MGNVYRPKCGEWVMLCGWRVKAGWLIPFVDKRGWLVKLCDPSLTRAIIERFRDAYHTHYEALSNVLFTTRMQKNS